MPPEALAPAFRLVGISIPYGEALLFLYATLLFTLGYMSRTNRAASLLCFCLVTGIALVSEFRTVAMSVPQFSQGREISLSSILMAIATCAPAFVLGAGIQYLTRQALFRRQARDERMAGSRDA